AVAPDRAREVLPALEPPVGADPPHRDAEGSPDPAVEHVVDERRLARAGDACDAGPGADGEAHVDVPEVVLGGRTDREPRGTVEGAARTEAGTRAVQVPSGER